jgi:hypothetical protein
MHTLWMVALLCQPALGGERDAPEISRSRGTSGGVLVLHPRVIPGKSSGTTRSAAWLVSSALSRLAKALDPSADIRPAPERVCPREGCEAVSLGALLLHHKKNCAVVGLIGAPGTEPTRLVPWAGLVDMATPTVPFRAYPEEVVTVRDFVPCEELGTRLKALESGVAEALAAAVAPSRAP